MDYSIKNAFKELELVESKLSDKFYIKFWETEELRDYGMSDEYFNNFQTVEDAIRVARKLVDRDAYASVEVYPIEDGEVVEEGEPLFGYDGVDTWGTYKTGLKESDNEDRSYGVFQSVEHYVWNRNPSLKVGYVKKGLTKEEAEAEAKKLNTKELNSKGIYYDVKQLDEYELSKDNLVEAAEDNSIEQGPWGPIKKKLKEEAETKKFSLTQSAKEAKEYADKQNQVDNENIEMIIDTDAETPEDLKQSYVGKGVIECIVCHALVYKDVDKIIKSEDDDNIFNIEEVCPNCGSMEGFHLIGKVAPLATDVNGEHPVEESGEFNLESGESGILDIFDESFESGECSHKLCEKYDMKRMQESQEDLEKLSSSKETLTEEYVETIIEELDEEVFDNLIVRYLKEVYENVESYNTTSGEVDDEKNQIVLEGNIKFKSGKEKPTKFIFEAIGLTKKGKVRLIGLNETFSTSKKAFTMLAEIKENKMVCESFNYNYQTKVLEETKLISGRIINSKRK